jgi:hypothetical protein
MAAAAPPLGAGRFAGAVPMSAGFDENDEPPPPLEFCAAAAA